MLRGKELRMIKANYSKEALNEWYKAYDKETKEMVAFGRLEDLLCYSNECYFEIF